MRSYTRGRKEGVKVEDNNNEKLPVQDILIGAEQKKPLEKIIEVKNIKKVYRMGHEKIIAVNDVSFDIMKGEFCCLLGTSGSGKSTLLNLMAGIEKATSGQIIIKGKNIPKLKENQLAKFRQDYLGFVFQSYNLINTMTALENVEFPLIFKKVGVRKRKRLAKKMLQEVGLGTRLKHKPKEMSGGQQQRVGIARAFVARPEIVFADEPTGNLDTRTTMEVMEIIRKMAKENNQTIVMVTHDPRLAAFADKIIRILDGKIQAIELVTDISDPEAVEAAELNLAAAVEAVNHKEDQETTKQEATDQEATDQEVTEQEATDQEVTDQEAKEQEVKDQEVKHESIENKKRNNKR
jgi:putative ABC transport system ATP-binding protein